MRWPTPLLGAICVFCWGCGGARQPATTQVDPEQQPAAAEPKSTAQKPAPATAPLEVKVLRPDPRSVVEQLQQRGVVFERNKRGNVRSVAFDGPCTPEDLRLLTRLRELKELRIERPEFAAADLSQLFDKLQLDVLQLGGRQVTSQLLAGIGSQRSLKELHLGGTRVDDALLQELAEHEQLQTVNLAWTRISDAGLSQVEWPRLQSLNLSFTALSDAALERLASMQQLESLDVSGTSISEAGAAQLRQSLPDTQLSGLPAQRPPPPLDTETPATPQDVSGTPPPPLET